MTNKRNYIIGGVIGDIIGSVYEFNNVKNTDFDFFNSRTSFTDDTVLTIATMDSILNSKDYNKSYQYYGRKYPNSGYGQNFISWLNSDNPQPYNSWGNGSAMRISPVGWAYDSIQDVLFHSKQSADVTHNHPEGIKGAQAVATAIFLARKNRSKNEIKQYITDTFGYDLNRSIDSIRSLYGFELSCQKSVPEAIIAFLESTDYETAIRLAISLGGDSDTIACITGSIAEAYYKEIPIEIIEKSLSYLPDEFINMIELFSNKFGIKSH
jgi:ADP-ribosylglycohydrolase